MNKTVCVFMLCGCFIRITVEWDEQANLDDACEQLAEKLGADFMYTEDLP